MNRYFTVILILLTFSVSAKAQITIGGSVYGGGRNGAVGTGNTPAAQVATAADFEAATVAAQSTATMVTVNSGSLNNIYGGGEKGNSKGQTNVVLRGGSINGSVYGGAMMADIEGYSHVNIDAANLRSDLVLANVYGGNDIAGNISQLAYVESTYASDLDKAVADGGKRCYVLNLFGGGNGDYADSLYTGSLERPTLAQAEIHLTSGCYYQIFGGGNMATVTANTTIDLQNRTQLRFHASQNADGSYSFDDEIPEYQFERVFGGNNKVAMDIRPTWNLQKASVENLYSGGNAGDMTYHTGILLEIASADMTVYNVYGGCRMANVSNSATVTVSDGIITNVYGGNDISGNVYGGTQVNIQSSVLGDVYGGGNGSYAYTDNIKLKDDAQYSDIFYEIPGVDYENLPSDISLLSAQALNAYRPNAENVTISLSGKSDAEPTYIGGSVYCGGNSATLRSTSGNLEAASATLKLGSYVIANHIFLGSNGANMVARDQAGDMLRVLRDGPVDYDATAQGKYSLMDLTDHDTFEEYMKGVEVAIKPQVGFVDDYVDYSSKVGSVYVGGNVGSMSATGYFNLSFLQKVVVFEKLVGGCNNANISAGAYNAYHEGGLTSYSATKVIMNVEGMKLQPMKLTANADGTFTFAENRNADGLLVGGNIYGGCYESGYINGGVEINIKQDAISSSVSDADRQLIRDNVFSTALSAFGGGYGHNAEIWGDVTVNISNEANIIKVFGGGEMGVVGRTKGSAAPENLFHEPLTANTNISITGGTVGKIYGGGFEGLVTGNTKVMLDGGKVYDAMAGACNADIDGYAQMLMGSVNGGATTTVEHNVYGGNDFGGRIASAATYTGANGQNVTANTYVSYQKGIVGNSIYGGACGSYDYSVAPYSTKAAEAGFYYPKFETLPTGGDINTNSFVDIRTTAASDKADGNIYGGGRGFLNAKSGDAQLAIVDMKQSYVLLRSQNATGLVADNILGGGYYSVVEHTLVDALSGRANILYGGTYGASATLMDENVSYDCNTTTVNLKGIKYDQLNVFGGGANTGARITYVNLLEGYVKDVYGGSNMEGVCDSTFVDVPASGKEFIAHAIYGGAYGSSDNLPCDVLVANVNFASDQAYVSGGELFGGNNNARASQKTFVTVSAPLRTAAGATLASVFGGGQGVNSVAGYTNVTLNSGAQVGNVYGGGDAGKVYGYYNDNSGAATYYNQTSHPEHPYAHWAFEAPVAGGNWSTAAASPNTNIYINEGATAQYVYGAGYGSQATVSGNTYVLLNGGKVENDIFGGGYSGNVQAMAASDLGAGGTIPADQTDNIYTYVFVRGGAVNNVYGGGYNGHVGLSGIASQASTDATNPNTRVEVGLLEGSSFTDGVPAITRSLYGGGYKGAVYGLAKVQIFNGYTGYTYNAAGHYEENLNYQGSTAKLLKENGNVFGGGYGEGATVDRTEVYLWNGTVRNSLYGGGEIAAIGRGSVNDDKKTATISLPGKTLVEMYGGLVAGNIFGGGRGYAVDAYGNTQNGEMGYSDGYTFGHTEVHLRRGTVGTDDTVLEGDGNIFGGGNIGYVYTATGTKDASDGYYYNNGLLTEDCRVLIAPYAKVLEAVTIDGTSYGVGEFVPTEKLNTLSASDAAWSKIDNLGITIGNAVFAGGNVSAGSDKVYANAKTVFGNATASVTDIFNKDFVVIGGDGIGGLYGDGNLTFVDGYRELNITNYGTDYYNLNNQLTYEQYMMLTDRERAYFELQYMSNVAHTYEFYECLHADYYGEIYYRKGQKLPASAFEALGLTDEEKTHWIQSSKNFDTGDKVSQDEYNLMDDAEQANWDLFGFCTLYAGRMINTIQRADFCGVFGSRIVMRGARDRVPSTVDYTYYTINRVDEVSLNQMPDPKNPTDASQNHGNYFGIYSVVNYLGALTSDVEFESERVTDNTDASYAPDGRSYYDWKSANLNNRKRNNGTSRNEVALASGVWLEIVDKSTETAGEKIYGPITGVVQLNLINVATGEGGGYVYAKNIHGVKTKLSLKQVTLTAANQGAVSYKEFSYADAVQADHMQTSGNFVNSLKRIVDDCYPENNAYVGSDAAPAHYWYVRGDFYVYEQNISAYTGSSQAYAESITIPLTITAEAQGRLRLESVNENLYAYWNDSYDIDKYQSPLDANAIIVQGVTYQKNDPISYWTYSRLTDEEKLLFTDETYVCSKAVSYNGKDYAKGAVLLPSEYAAMPTDQYVCEYDFVDGDAAYTEGTVLTQAQWESLSASNQDKCATVRSFFNISNALSHDEGFLLTFDWDNPDIWNDYYQHAATAGDADQQVVRKSVYDTYDATTKAAYVTAPSLRSTTTSVMGQLQYTQGDLIEKEIYDYQAQVTTDLAANGLTDTRTGQASFEKAWVAKQACKFTDNGRDYNYVEGACISDTEYQAFSATGKAYFTQGMLCTKTYQRGEDEYYLRGSVLTLADYNTLLAEDAEIADHFSDPYICTKDGAWGGSLFVQTNNYPALKYANLTAAERQNFTYNYDALDLMSENFNASDILHYQGGVGNHANAGKAIAKQNNYAEEEAIDYTARYEGEDMTADNCLAEEVLVTRDGSQLMTNMLKMGDILKNTAYESLTNEQFKFTPITASGTDDADKVFYVVKEGFQTGDNYYTVGNQITEAIYQGMTSSNKNKVALISRSSLPNYPTGSETKSYYFCTRKYTAISPHTDINGVSYAVGDEVPVGTIISADHYNTLTNEQKNFEIDGKIPTSLTTLYVSREVDINQLSQDKIVTVIYWYEYIESDETGMSYETIRERHIVNIRIHFESGVPTIGELLPPSTVLPSTAVGLNTPTIEEGAYELLGGGWEMYSNEADAYAHKNGAEYVNRNTPMYWYQDGYYVAYYAKSYLGKTYSNPVQFSVANYHRMSEVMSNTHSETLEDNSTVTVNDYMYLNDAIKAGKRAPKVYIKDNADMEAFASFFNKTLTEENLDLVRGGSGIDFILAGDVALSGSWTSLGDDSQCFEGNFHGDGHALTGLDHSLFGNLCGKVYNLGVAGSFSSAGIADQGSGSVKNCWIYTTNTAAKAVNAVLGTPSHSNAQEPQIINCYYNQDAAYNNPVSTHGLAKAMPVRAYLDGQVAFLLNGFYLEKRYQDSKSLTAGQQYRYWPLDKLDGKITMASTAYYEDDVETYVEERYQYADFIYADGTIPLTTDVRHNMNETYSPVYPDDYIYFGQSLSYNIVTGGGKSDEYPHAVARTTDKKLLRTDAADTRVYRAPGYYQSKQMSTVYFNGHAAFVDDYVLTPVADGGIYAAAETMDVYKTLTAIDFTGHGDASWQKGWNDGLFYTPLLDFEGVYSFQTDGITRNLLVYINPADGDASSADSRTDAALATFSKDPAYDDYYQGDGYRSVSKNEIEVMGHVVYNNGGNYIAYSDHFLVDKNDFNAPIAYTFDTDKRMWYQREPDKFITSMTQGWESVSLPFEVELLSTNQKGELTHFYGDSNKGHEYWLRAYADATEDATASPVSYTVNMNRPASQSGASKTATSTFLWDYYYEGTTSAGDNTDENTDAYQRQYYQNARDYDGYAYQQAATPYLVGFPGSNYYEFDLSGGFIAQNSGSGTPAQLNRQTISFVSQTGISIAVSDDETNEAAVAASGYAFKPNYLNRQLPVSTGLEAYYVMNDEASAFVQTTAAMTAAQRSLLPFRCYFAAAQSAGEGGSAPALRSAPDKLLIGNSDAEPAPQPDLTGLHVWTKRGRICISNATENELTLPIYSGTGVLVTKVTLQPMEQQTVPVGSRGLYLVGTTKVIVR